MEPRELLPGLWRWETAHPEWTPEDADEGGWEQVVASYAVESPDGPVLIDPLVGDDVWPFVDGLVERAAAPPHVLVTLFWHARSSRDLSSRYEGARVWAHEPAAELVRERTPVTDTFRPGETLPGGIRAIDAGRAYEVFLWLPAYRALVAADALLGAPGGGVRVCPAAWLLHVDAETFRAGLRERLLGLPVEHVLPTHGEAVVGDGRAALVEALQ